MLEPPAPIVRLSSVAPSLVSVASFVHGKESILSSRINLHVQATSPKIPDGGWGWFIVLAAFFINMISDGVAFTFGLLYLEFLNEFGASKSATSWIGSLFMAVPLISGPVMSALVDRYGCRSMTILGGLISTLGFILSSFSRSIGVMYVTFGVIGGMGLGLCMVTAVVSIAFWFEKKRTIAMGLGACGTGFGTIVFSPLCTFLLNEYGWRGTILIMAGLFFNTCVCGALMRDPDWISEEKTHSESSRSSLESQQIKNPKTEDYLLQKCDTSVNLSKNNKYQSVINLPTYVKENELVPYEVIKKLSQNKNLYNVILENYPHIFLNRCNSQNDLHEKPAKNPLTVHVKVAKSPHPTQKRFSFSQDTKLTLGGKDSNLAPESHYLEALLPKFPQSKSNSYLKNMRLQRNSMSYRGAMLNLNKYRLKASSCPHIFKNSMTTLAKESEEKWYDDFLELLKDITHFSLFLELHFFLMCLSTILLFTWFVIPYFYLADLMTTYGYSENQASFVISIIGVTNTVGMVALGWAGDQPWLHTTKTYAVCLILCGISCSAMLFFINNYILLLVTAALFGIFFASSFSYTPAILTDLVSLDSFTMAYGLILLCQGIGNLLGPPLGGLLFDLTKSWDQSYYQAGFWIIISGVLVGIIPFTKNKKMI